MEVPLIFLAVLVAINLWATRRVMRADEDYNRKVMLIVGVWVIPFMGAFIAKQHARAAPSAAQIRATQEAAGIDREPAPKMIGGDGSAQFDVQHHLIGADTIPVLDWKALDAWADTVDDRTAAINQGRKAWLLHLRDKLGPYAALYESDETYVLSSLEPTVAKAAAAFVSKAKGQIDQLLHGVAKFSDGDRNILLVLDSEEDYYHYVSIYYPDDGEYSFSGGMFVDFGCPHFVTVRADLKAMESVIAHEMTHSAVSHLRLPTWLDEGIAVNTEHRLAGVKRLLHAPHELHQMHLRFWNEQTIQEFWSGRSFHRTDDGNLLSYELARIVVEQMARSDWERFKMFVGTAKREDAGAGAAASALNVDLGKYVGALVEVSGDQDWSPCPETWT